jgi:hypothetical protein
VRRRLLVSLVAAGALSFAPGVPSEASADSSLSALGEGAVTVNAKSGQDTAPAYLTLMSSATTPMPIKVDLAASSSEAVNVAGFTPKTLTPGQIARVTVTLSGLKKLSEPATGELVVTGGTTPVTRSLSIAAAPQPSESWATIIVVGALIAMAVLALGVALVVRLRKHSWQDLGKQAPGPKWSYSSWATTLTAVGAILGTVLGSATLPAVARETDKDTLIRLNLLFGALVVTAPFVFQAIRNPKATPADQEAGLWGFNWSLLLACSITCAAVLGELGTLALLAWVLIGGGGWGWVAVAFIGVLFLLAVYYFLITAWALATTDWNALVKKDKKTATDAAKSIVVGIAAASRGEQLEEIPVASAPPVQRTWSLP